MVCYRRRGHNEGDDPSMTQPLMYNLIEAKRSVRKLYTEALIGRGDITVEDAEAALRDYQQQLERVFVETKEAIKEAGAEADGRAAPAPTSRATPASSRRPRRRDDADATALGDQHRRSRPRCCSTSATRSPTSPEGFTVHPKLRQLLEKRAPAMTREGGIDWAMGELLAFGSLLIEGTPVRLAGQDSRRGTFVQRHAVLIDKVTGREWTPLLYLGEGQARFWVYDSLLSRVRRDGLRVRLLRRAARRPGAVGGAVRRLRQRRADDHRRVHLVVRAEVGPALLGRAAAAARLRGPGPGPLVRPHRAVPAAVRRGQHDGRLPVDPGVVLPPAAPSGLRPAAPPADRLHPEVDAAAARRRRPASRTSPRARSARSCPTPAQLDAARRDAGCCSPPARSSTTSRPSATKRGGHRDGDRAGRAAATRSRPPRSPRRSPCTPAPRSSWVQDEPAQPGRVAVHGAQPARGAGELGETRPLRVVVARRPRPPPPPARTRSTRSSRRTWSPRPSTADRRVGTTGGASVVAAHGRNLAPCTSPTAASRSSRPPRRGGGLLRLAGRAAAHVRRPQPRVRDPRRAARHLAGPARRRGRVTSETDEHRRPELADEFRPTSTPRSPPRAPATSAWSSSAPPWSPASATPRARAGSHASWAAPSTPTST